MQKKQKGFKQLQGILGQKSGCYNAIVITQNGTIRISKQAKDIRSQKTINKQTSELRKKK